MTKPKPTKTPLPNEYNIPTLVKSESHAKFDLMMEQTWASILSLSALKGGEYAGDFDRLANFKRNARDCNCTPELIWRIYAGKHWDAVTQYISDRQNGKTRQRGEPIEGRIDDLILYLLLFKFMVLTTEQ